jgi:hypothetical protein
MLFGGHLWDPALLSGEQVRSCSFAPPSACDSFVEHYLVERAHQGLDNMRISASEPGTGDVQYSERLGGILRSYSRAA